ncbi:MAG: ATP-binding protein [Candidatus Hadarchaeum sp.]|uniref:ATP-binding protein n=1 Tax=Candidatus Hadarchaeum sp. TaxID=2883567 RepID=UPI003D0A87CE
MEIGTVIVDEDSPSPCQFSFVVTSGGGIPVRQGQFVAVVTEEGRAIAFVTSLVKTNRYFMRAESVREYERRGRPLNSIFPADRWEYLVARAQVLGVQGAEGLERNTFPPSPGQRVLTVEGETLAQFLGLRPSGGVEIGRLKHHDFPVRLDLTKLLRKHVAVLAMSGSGKSHFATVLVEELLDRPAEQGRPALVIVDVHGEYVGLADSPNFSGMVAVVNGNDVRIGVPNLNAYQFKEFLPDISGVQLRELQKVLENLRAEMRNGKGSFDLDDVISRVEAEEGLNKQLQQALVGWLNDLQSLGIFDHADNPNWERAVFPGRALVMDLSEITSLRRKQMLVAHAARRLFQARKRNRVPPFLLCLEEAHQFCPSGDSREAAISRPALETIAREGRKFYASLMLISQRPVRLSTTVLSQASTNVILRITNPYDLEHIKQSSESITKEAADMISTLPVGEALIVGEAVNYPIFVKIRQRRSPSRSGGLSIEEAVQEFERMSSGEEEDAKAFM